MRLFFIFILFAIFLKGTEAPSSKHRLREDFTVRIVAKGLSDPWEVCYGPDNYLWSTEAKGYRDDNPFNSKKQNGVWSYGHRNPQGLIYAVVGGKGRIYSSEHGPFSDDEINIIEKGKNYGHPLVIGFDDNNYNGLAAAVSDHKDLPGPWHTTYPLIINEHDNVLAMHNEFQAPIKTFYPSSNSFLLSLLTTIKNGNSNQTPQWFSEAPSSIEIYTSSAIPEWHNSLLIPTLKRRKTNSIKTK